MRQYGPAPTDPAPILVTVGTCKRGRPATPEAVVPAHPAIVRQRAALNARAWEAGRAR